MKSYKEVLDRIRRLPASEMKMISKGSGVPLSTVLKLHYGAITNPRVSTADDLMRYFESVQAVSIALNREP